MERPEERQVTGERPVPEEPPVPEDGPAGEVPEGADGPAAAPRPRRRGRTVLLIAGAAVLGLVAGTCVGYLVQADREPTRLPPLSQPVVGQAKGEVAELTAAQDRRVKTDGDLRELLLDRPKGARDTTSTLSADGWLDLGDFADGYEEPEEIFGDLITDEFRRTAVTAWRTGGTHTVEIHLAQFRQEESLAASAHAEDGHYWAEDEPDTRSWPVPGTGDGMAYVHDTPDEEPGYLPLYSAEAHAWRGDIAMDIWVFDSKPISKEKIMDLAERQMERL